MHLPAFEKRYVRARKDLWSVVVLLCLELRVVIVGRVKVKLVALRLGEHLLDVAVEVGDDDLLSVVKSDCDRSLSFVFEHNNAVNVFLLLMKRIQKNTKECACAHVCACAYACACVFVYEGKGY